MQRKTREATYTPGGALCSSGVTDQRETTAKEVKALTRGIIHSPLSPGPHFLLVSPQQQTHIQLRPHVAVVVEQEAVDEKDGRLELRQCGTNACK